VAIVFEPMVPGDDRQAAQAALLADPRVRCFWDAGHACARAFGAAQRERIVPKLLATLPPDAPWRETLASWDPEQQPLWDAGWFYAARAAWPAKGLPEHAMWCKQFDFEQDENGAVRAGFFRGEGWEAELAWTSWREQFARGMESVR